MTWRLIYWWDGRGDVLAIVRPIRVYLLDFFCSSIQFYLLLSSYHWFISFLYLNLYVLGHDELISKGSFMQTEHQCVLIHIWTKGEVVVPWNRFKPSSKIVLLTVNVPSSASFMNHLCYFCLIFVMPSCASVYWCLVVTCWKRADLLALVCDV